MRGLRSRILQELQNQQAIASSTREINSVDSRRSHILQSAKALAEPERRVLAVLADDARMTNAALAAALEMPPSTALARTQTLRGRGVIRGFHTSVDRRALGLSLEMFVSVDLIDQHADTVQAFLQRARSLEYVMGIMRMTGASDFVLHVYVASTEDLMEFVIGPLSGMPELRRTDTSLVVDHWRRQSCIGTMSRA